VVDNRRRKRHHRRAGGGGRARRRHTLLIMADNFASAASVRPNSYDPVNDLDPVILLARGDYALMASASFPRNPSRSS